MMRPRPAQSSFQKTLPPPGTFMPRPTPAPWPAISVPYAANSDTGGTGLNFVEASGNPAMAEPEGALQLVLKCRNEPARFSESPRSFESAAGLA